MFILKVLGGAAIEGPEGLVTGRPAQKRRLALLALLAMSRTGRLGREKLIAYLWPDRDAESARHLLSDAVYVINRALGPDTLASAGDELRVNEARLRCDARGFEAAAGEDPRAAVQLYAGPFLDGFHLDGAEELEGWITRERDRLGALFASALERTALAHEAAGEDRAALDAWRRLAAEDAYSSRATLRLCRTLERLGDHAGALQAAQAHAAFLRAELGLHPPSELRAFIGALQAAPLPPAPAEREIVAAEPAAPAAPPEPVEVPAHPAGVRHAEPPPPHAGTPRHRWSLAVAALVVLALVAWYVPQRAGDASKPLQSIAVMPFEDVGGNDATRYFTEGIADELTTRLGRDAGLKVAARTSAFALKARQMDARAIGRALGVDALLEGSVGQTGGRVQLAVRLVSTRDGYQVWADSWTRPIDEMPALQDQAAAAVRAALGGRRAPEAAATTPNVPSEAYHLYLQGRYLWHQRTRESLQRAAENFERAVALAPDYAGAHSGLADAYAVLGFYDYLPPGDAFPRAKAAAQRALDLDPQLAQAHASLGYVALYYDWNWADAEAAFQRAIALNPSYSVGHQWYGNLLTARGRFDEAGAAMRRAQSVDPLSLIASAALGWVHFFQRDYEAAAAQCRRTLAMNPGFELAHLWAGWAEEGAGRYAEALVHLREAVRLSSDGAVALASLGRAQALAGDRDAAQATLAALHRAHAGYLPAYELAKLHLALGERDAALAWLRRAREERSHSIAFLGVDPQLDALRGDPRFAELEAGVTR